MQITFKPERGCCGYEGFGATTFTFGEEWTEFSVTTPVLAEPVPEGQITFHIAFTPGVLWMDGIRFYEGEYVPPPDSEPEPQEPAFVRGDVDSSGTIELADPLKLLLFSFAGGGPPDCEDAADVDDDGTFSGVTDAVGILLWLFQGGDPFPTPMPSGAAYLSGDCGADPTADALECEVTATICSG
jgi:hypothetical protein